MEKEAQVSIEIMILLVLMLFVLSIILTVNDAMITGADNNFNGKKANLLLDTASQTGDLVYQQGVGAKQKVFVAMPKAVTSITLKGRLINLTLNTSGNPVTLYRKTNFNITGSIPVQSGNYWLLFQSMAGKVNVTWLTT
jgi:uncharacterized protein (UPF0333 family)